MEERGQLLELADAVPGGAAVVELVEEGDGGTAEQPFRYERGCDRQLSRAERERCAPGARRERIPGHVLPSGEYGAPRRPAAGEEIDPGGRIAVAVVPGGEPGQQVVQVDGPFGVHRHPGAGDPVAPERGGEDHARQTQAARGRVEEIGAGPDRTDLALGGQQLQLLDVPREGAGEVMVAAVDVGADRAAHGDMTGGRCDGDEPAERQQDFHQPVQADPGVADHQAGPGVDGADPVQRGHVEDGAARVLCGVAVGPAEPPGDGTAGPATAYRRRRLLVRTGAEAQRGRRGGTAPAGQGHGVDRHGGDRIARENPFEGFVTTLTDMGD